MVSYDFDRSGFTDLLISAPYGEIGEIFHISGSENANCQDIDLEMTNKTAVLHSGEATIAGLFGYSMKIVPRLTSRATESLLVSAPKSSVLFQYKIKDTFTFKMTVPESEKIFYLNKPSCETNPVS